MLLSHKPPPLSGVTAPPSGAYLTQTVHLSDVSLRFEIWDTAGQEKYHSVTPLYYRGAHVALVVYDISSRVGRKTTGWPRCVVSWLVFKSPCSPAGNVCQSSAVAQRAGQAVRPRLDGRLAGGQQGRPERSEMCLREGIQKY